jgi:hypothetical protein
VEDRHLPVACRRHEQRLCVWPQAQVHLGPRSRSVIATHCPTRRGCHPRRRKRRCSTSQCGNGNRIDTEVMEQARAGRHRFASSHLATPTVRKQTPPSAPSRAPHTCKTIVPV